MEQRANESQKEYLSRLFTEADKCISVLKIELMGQEEIDLSRLCYYDKRNPDFQIKEEYGYDKEEVARTGNFAKEGCACDNCFYGRSKLTEQLIRQAQRMYSEEEVIKIIQECKSYLSFFGDEFDEMTWFKQFKKTTR